MDFANKWSLNYFCKGLKTFTFWFIWGCSSCHNAQIFQTSQSNVLISTISYVLHRVLLPVTLAPYNSCPKWNIKLLKTTKNGGNESNKVVLFFLWGHIEIMWKLQSCHIISLAVIFKRVMGGCVNSDWINAEVCLVFLPKSYNLCQMPHGCRPTYPTVTSVVWIKRYKARNYSAKSCISWGLPENGEKTLCQF